MKISIAKMVIWAGMGMIWYIYAVAEYDGRVLKIDGSCPKTTPRSFVENRLDYRCMCSMPGTVAADDGWLYGIPVYLIIPTASSNSTLHYRINQSTRFEGGGKQIKNSIAKMVLLWAGMGMIWYIYAVAEYDGRVLKIDGSCPKTTPRSFVENRLDYRCMCSMGLWEMTAASISRQGLEITFSSMIL